MQCHAIKNVNATGIQILNYHSRLVDKLEVLIIKGLSSSNLLVNLPVMPDEDE